MTLKGKGRGGRDTHKPHDIDHTQRGREGGRGKEEDRGRKWFAEQ